MGNPFHVEQRALIRRGARATRVSLLEPYGHLVDGLSDCMDADETLGLRIDGRMPLGFKGDLYRRVQMGA